MDTSVSLVVALEDISEREEGEIIDASDEENGLENVSSSEDEVVLSNSHIQAKRRKIETNFRHHIKSDTAQVHQHIRKHESLSDISDLEPEPAFCKKYNSIPGRVKDSFTKFSYRTRQTYDKEKLKSIQRTVRTKEYTRPRRTSENHSSRGIPHRRSRHRHSRSKTKERHNGDISSSDTETREDIEKRRKLKEALSIDSTNKTDLKNRLMKMLGKGKDKVDKPSVPLGNSTSKDEVIVIDEISSDEDIDLLRLRLLALKSKNFEKDVLENKENETVDPSLKKDTDIPNEEQTNDVSDDSTSKEKLPTKDQGVESEEVLQLRIQALKSAMIRKHLARIHKNNEDGQANKASTVVDSCESLSCEKDFSDDLTDVPYSPTQSISDIITSEEMSDLVDNMNVSDPQADKIDDLVNTSSEVVEITENVEVENPEVPHMDSGQVQQNCEIALPQEPCAPIPEISKTVLNIQKSAVKLRKTRTKSFTKYANKTNSIKVATITTEQNGITIKNHKTQNCTESTSSASKSLDSSIEEDEGILREMLLANINKSQASKNTDTNSLEDEDEDILRAMLLSKLSNKMATTQINAVKNKENTLVVKNDSKTHRTPRSKILKGQIHKKLSRSPMKLIKKTVTNTKVINKRVAKSSQKPVLKPKESESNTKQKIPSVVVPKLIINLGADSDTDDENPFKCKSPKKSEEIELPVTEVKLKETTEKVVLPEQIQDNTNTNQPSSISPDFEKSLDVFLKTARSKVECEVTEKPIPKKVITPAKQIVTPKIVRHMSLSQQKEYKQLLQKIMVLEKNKLTTKKTSNSIKAPNATTKTNHKNTSIKKNNTIVKSKEKFANDMKIEIKSDLQSETRKVITIEKNVNTPKELKNICLNDNCINITLGNELAVQSANTKDLLASNSNICIDQENNLEFKDENKTDPQNTTLAQLKKTMDQLKDAKIKELQKNEKFLIQKRMDFISDVDNLLKMVTKVEIEKGKQTALEKEVSDLKERLKYAETKLQFQNKLTGKLFDSVSQSKKRLELRKRQCITINYKCMSLGSQITSSYRSPMDGSELMKEKVQQLSLKMAKLPKDNSSTKVDGQLKLNNKIVSPIPNPKILAKMDVPKKKIENINKIIENKSVDEKKIEGAQMEKVVPNEGEFIPLSDAEGFNKIPEMISGGQATEFKVSDYESPLSTMENQSASDPNAVLCPYDLMGRCEDSLCKFKHLSQASDLQSL